MTFDLASFGWDEGFRATYARFDRSDQQPARVSRIDRGICSLLGAHGAHRASIGGGLLAAVAQDPVWLPCAGDWVVVRTWPDDRQTIEAVLPRRTVIARAASGAEALVQVLAVNVEAAAVVVSVDPDLDLDRIERLLTLAWESGAQPLVILTKVDLVSRSKPADIAEKVAQAAPGVPVFSVSAARGTGLDPLRPFVASGRTLGLLGAAGAGKSTLVNALAGAAVLGTQSIRRADGHVRHATTCRGLIPLPGGGAVLDTPGIRAVGSPTVAYPNDHYVQPDRPGAVGRQGRDRRVVLARSWEN